MLATADARIPNRRVAAVAKRSSWGYYHELLTGHTERTFATVGRVRRRIRPQPMGRAECVELVARSVARSRRPADLDKRDRQMKGRRFASADDCRKGCARTCLRTLRRYDPYLQRRSRRCFSAWLTSSASGRPSVASGQLVPRSGSRILTDGWFGVLSFIASGPPAHRLHECWPCPRRGIVEFLGAGMWGGGSGNGRSGRGYRTSPSTRPTH